VTNSGRLEALMQTTTADAVYHHDTLPCGIEYAVRPLPGRHVVSMEIRVLAGMSEEPPDRLGLAHILEDTITKGTERRDARALSDAFDAIGASRGGGAGLETTTFTCTVLPEFFQQAVALHAEFLRTPTFPQDMLDVAIELTRQEHLALQDDAQELADKYLSRQVYGPVLGRHTLGEPETIGNITRGAVVGQWEKFFAAGRVQVSVAGAVEPARVAAALEREFAGFGAAARAGREHYRAEFSARTTHYDKQLEQEQIGIAFPGVYVTAADYPTQRVVIGILAGGMSARLFTEVREKQGLVYWVSAWQETPRGAGMIFLGASTTPERCDRTHHTLLREIDRLTEDLDQEELERTLAGIEASTRTRGYTTRALCAELADDLFHRGRPMPTDEKLALLRAVTIDDVKAFLAAHPRDRLSVVTLGPKALSE